MRLVEVEFDAHEAFAKAVGHRVASKELLLMSTLEVWKERKHSQTLLLDGEIAAARISMDNANTKEAQGKEESESSQQQATELYSHSEETEKAVGPIMKEIEKLDLFAERRRGMAKKVYPDQRSIRQRWRDDAESARKRGERSVLDEIDSGEYRTRIKMAEDAREQAEVERKAQEKRDAEAAKEAAVGQEELNAGEEKAAAIRAEVT